jgi:hypothetical protein
MAVNRHDVLRRTTWPEGLGNFFSQHVLVRSRSRLEGFFTAAHHVGQPAHLSKLIPKFAADSIDSLGIEAGDDVVAALCRLACLVDGIATGLRDGSGPSDVGRMKDAV